MYKRLRAFTLTELLISVVIMTLLGGAAIASFWLLLGVFSQTEDRTGAREEIEFVFQTIGREVTNISLGMPNNRGGKGTFAESFRGRNGSPIMAQMGNLNEDWGGPVTIGLQPPLTGNNYGDAGKVKTRVSFNGSQVAIGTVLFYAWGVPMTTTISNVTSVLKANSKNWGPFGTNGTAPETLVFELVQAQGVQALIDFQYDGRPSGIVAGNNSQVAMRSWVVFPTLRIPMIVEGWVTHAGATGGAPLAGSPPNSVTMTAAPGSRKALSGFLSGFDEFHSVQACRIFLNDRAELVQEIYGSNFLPDSGAVFSKSSTVKVLAHNIAGVCFVYDSERRLLTMYIAARGVTSLDEEDRNAQPHSWPVVSDQDVNNRIKLSSDDMTYRVLVESKTWRIRN